MKTILTLVLFLISTHSKANSGYESGKAFGSSIIESCPVKADYMQDIQGYGERYETFTAEDLDSRKKILFSDESLEANEDLKNLHDQGVKHKAHIVHPNDPLITRAYEALTNPEKFLTDEVHEEDVVTDWEEKACNEQAERETTHSCTHELIKASQIEKRNVYWRTHYWGDLDGGINHYDYHKTHQKPVGEKHQRWSDGCNVFQIHIQNEFKYQKRTVSVGRSGDGESTDWVEISKEEYDKEAPSIPDEWLHNCTRYTAGSSVWSCRKMGEKCLEGPVTKTRAGVDFTRPCWLKQETYQCGYNSANSCEDMREGGCYEIGVKCKVKDTVGGKEICRVWEKVMRCPKSKTRQRRSNGNRDLPGCTGGDCSDEKSTANKDFLKALSKLALLKQIQDENDKGSDRILSVFKGGSRTCTTSKYGYENCCKTSEGWMTSFGGRCKPEEKQLAKDRQNGLCVEVGKFCSKKIKTPLGSVCRQEKTAFCCFPSRISRLIQEQGRRQLRIKGEGGLHWGPAEGPNCKGFTIDQLSRINFERIDTRELYAALNAKKRVTPTANISSKISARMTAMVDRLGNNDKARGA